MSSAQLYDTIGATYTVTRRTEPRIAARIWAALGDARTVLNVGAGTGSYEPPGRDVTAVEPSPLMRAQRPAGAARRTWLPSQRAFRSRGRSFGAAIALSTVHHSPGPIAGLRKVHNIARRVVVFTHDFQCGAGSRRRCSLSQELPPRGRYHLLVRRRPAHRKTRAIGAHIEQALIPSDCTNVLLRGLPGAGPGHTWTRMSRRGVSVWARVGPRGRAAGSAQPP